MEITPEYYIFEIHHEPEAQYKWTSATDHYSSKLTATAKYHERVSLIMKSPSFDKAVVMLIGSNGSIIQTDAFDCSYVAPESQE